MNRRPINPETLDERPLVLVRAVIETNFGTVIAMCDDDENVLFFDEDDMGGPANTIAKPAGLSLMDVSSVLSFLIDYLRTFDSKVEVKGAVVEVLLGKNDLPK